MNYLKKLVPFSFSEKLALLKFTVGSKLVNGVPMGLKNTYLLTKDLILNGVSVKKYGEHFKFNYPVNEFSLNFELKRNSSDALVFKQIILEKEYLYILEILQSLHIPMRTMIDCGANIGLTSLYFKAKFPSLKIIALEPSNDTFLRLKRNIEVNQFQDIIPIKKGLWNIKTKLKSDNTFRDGQDWSFRLLEAKPEEIADFETVSVNDLLFEFDLQEIDFLKIDIEGGEAEVFKLDADLCWLSKVKIIAIEIHDEFNCRDQIESILRNYNFKISYTGDLTIGVNNNMVA